MQTYRFCLSKKGLPVRVNTPPSLQLLSDASKDQDYQVWSSVAHDLSWRQSFRPLWVYDALFLLALKLYVKCAARIVPNHGVAVSLTCSIMRTHFLFNLPCFSSSLFRISCFSGFIEIGVYYYFGYSGRSPRILWHYFGVAAPLTVGGHRCITSR